MIEGIFLLYCLPLDDNKFRDYTDIQQYANYLTVQHYPDEVIFDINGLAKSNSDENCYWITIEEY
jgi:hypothetical protein|tara:strand:+ start:780 stop:974 length:195 start_codon:yes stop_codon:yes gene_type:complete